MLDSGFVVREPARLAVPYADGNPRAVRMGEPHRVEDLVFSPARAFDQRSFQSGGGGMVGTAGDFMTFLETLRTGGPILTRETVELASRNQVGRLREQDEPGWGFGFLSAVLTDAERAGSPAHAGTLSWGGVYGHSWFHDPAAELSVVSLTNTALEGSRGSFPADVQASIYASPAPDSESFRSGLHD
jgi:CubicO group peptidase (beta-lactamase class C family)